MTNNVQTPGGNTTTAGAVEQLAHKASRRFYDETDANLNDATLEKLDAAFARFGFALLDIRADLNRALTHSLPGDVGRRAAFEAGYRKGQRDLNGNVQAYGMDASYAEYAAALTPSALSGDAGEIGLREALQDIARQRLTSEMDEDQAEHADYEGAYDIIVGIARAALPSQQGTEP